MPPKKPDTIRKQKSVKEDFKHLLGQGKKPGESIDILSIRYGMKFWYVIRCLKSRLQ